MLLIERKNFDRHIRIVLALGILIGLAWGFCVGILFEQYRGTRPKLPAPIMMKGIEF